MPQPKKSDSAQNIRERFSESAYRRKVTPTNHMPTVLLRNRNVLYNRANYAGVPKYQDLTFDYTLEKQKSLPVDALIQKRIEESPAGSQDFYAEIYQRATDFYKSMLTKRQFIFSHFYFKLNGKLYTFPASSVVNFQIEFPKGGGNFTINDSSGLLATVLMPKLFNPSRNLMLASINWGFGGYAAANQNTALYNQHVDRNPTRNMMFEKDRTVLITNAEMNPSDGKFNVKVSFIADFYSFFTEKSLLNLAKLLNMSTNGPALFPYYDMIDLNEKSYMYSALKFFGNPMQGFSASNKNNLLSNYEFKIVNSPVNNMLIEGSLDVTHLHVYTLAMGDNNKHRLVDKWIKLDRTTQDVNSSIKNEFFKFYTQLKKDNPSTHVKNFVHADQLPTENDEDLLKALSHNLISMLENGWKQEKEETGDKVVFPRGVMFLFIYEDSVISKMQSLGFINSIYQYNNDNKNKFDNIKKIIDKYVVQSQNNNRTDEFYIKRQLELYTTILGQSNYLLDVSVSPAYNKNPQRHYLQVTANENLSDILRGAGDNDEIVVALNELMTGMEKFYDIELDEEFSTSNIFRFLLPESFTNSVLQDGKSIADSLNEIMPEINLRESITFSPILINLMSNVINNNSNYEQELFDNYIHWVVDLFSFDIEPLIDRLKNVLANKFPQAYIPTITHKNLESHLMKLGSGTDVSMFSVTFENYTPSGSGDIGYIILSIDSQVAETMEKMTVEPDNVLSGNIIEKKLPDTIKSANVRPTNHMPLRNYFYKYHTGNNVTSMNAEMKDFGNLVMANMGRNKFTPSEVKEFLNQYTNTTYSLGSHLNFYPVLTNQGYQLIMYNNIGNAGTPGNSPEEKSVNYLINNNIIPNTVNNNVAVKNIFIDAFRELKDANSVSLENKKDKQNLLLLYSYVYNLVDFSSGYSIPILDSLYKVYGVAYRRENEELSPLTENSNYLSGRTELETNSLNYINFFNGLLEGFAQKNPIAISMLEFNSVAYEFVKNIAINIMGFTKEELDSNKSVSRNNSVGLNMFAIMIEFLNKKIFNESNLDKITFATNGNGGIDVDALNQIIKEIFDEIKTKIIDLEKYSDYYQLDKLDEIEDANDLRKIKDRFYGYYFEPRRIKNDDRQASMKNILSPFVNDDNGRFRTSVTHDGFIEVLNTFIKTDNPNSLYSMTAITVFYFLHYGIYLYYNNTKSFNEEKTLKEKQYNILYSTIGILRGSDSKNILASIYNDSINLKSNIEKQENFLIKIPKINISDTFLVLDTRIKQSMNVENGWPTLTNVRSIGLVLYDRDSSGNYIAQNKIITENNEVTDTTIPGQVDGDTKKSVKELFNTLTKQLFNEYPVSIEIETFGDPLYGTAMEFNYFSEVVNYFYYQVDFELFDTLFQQTENIYGDYTGNSNPLSQQNVMRFGAMRGYIQDFVESNMFTGTYMVKAVTHTIQNGVWKTKIKLQKYIRPANLEEYY